MKISYVNGKYLRHIEAAVHIDDRGFQFADGAYEMLLVTSGKLLFSEEHFLRLKLSLDALSIRMPTSFSAMEVIMRELVRRNRIKEGYFYIQITRGVAPRAHPFPKGNISPSLIMTLTPTKGHPIAEYENGVRVVTQKDTRWGRCDIKSISLLPNILAKEKAIAEGSKETWLINDDGDITEGSASNCYLIDKYGTLITHHADQAILSGITRNVILELAKQSGINVEIRPFRLKEVQTGAEAFISSTTIGIMPVIKVNNITIGNGKPGKITKRLEMLYEERTKKYIAMQY